MTYRPQLNPLRICFALLLATMLTFANDGRSEVPMGLQETLEQQQTAEALKHFEKEALEILDDPLDRGEFLRLVGFQYEAVNARHLAHDAYDRSVRILEKLPPSAQLVHSLGERSYIEYLRTGKPADYCPDRERAVTVAREISDPEVLVSALVRRAFCYDKPDLMHRALDDLQEAMSVAEAENLELDMQAMILNASGNLYRTLKLYDRAYAAYHDAYLIWRDNDDVSDYFNMLHNMVGEAIPLGRWPEAVQWVSDMFSVAEREGENKDYAFFAHFNRGRLSLARGEFESADAAFTAVLDLSETTVEKRFVAHSLLLRAAARFWLQDLEAARDDLATYASSGREPDDEFKFYSGMTRAIERENFAEAISVMNDWRKQQQDERIAFLDTNTRYFTDEHERQVAAYESDLLKQRIELQALELARSQDRAELARQSNLTLGMAALLLVVLALWLGMLLRKHSRRAYTDYLTGVANRAHVFQQGNRMFRRAKRKNRQLAVVLIDIDHFKQVNDRFGHEVGDRALVATVTTVQNCLNGGELIGRLGGEEFIVILPGHELQEARERAEEFRKAVTSEAGFRYRGDARVHFTVSLGVAAQTAAEDFQSLVNRADAALYHAKADGRDRVRVFDASRPIEASVIGSRRTLRE